MTGKRSALALGMALALSACAGREAPPEPTPTAVPVGVHVTHAAFGRLAWLEGRWRGEGIDQPPFYERYELVNDSTMSVATYTDSTFTTIDGEPGEVRWRDGLVTTGTGGALYVATEYDDGMIRFDPVAGARNSFVWRRVSDDAWTAVLSWPVPGETARRERVYHLRRWP